MELFNSVCLDMRGIIYVLEDDQGIREVIELILGLESYVVKSFTTINDFMSADRRSADLFLLDVMLPDGNGIEVCKELKSSITTREVPVVIMSAHADLKNLGKECPAEGFITKPFDINKFLQKIGSQIARKN